jgi:isochorismate hydrolase
MKTAHPYIAFTLVITGIIATMCILLTQIKATYRNDIRKIDAATTAAR